MNKTMVLDLIAEMKREAKTPRERQYYDGMAIGLISQEIEPIKMAENLDHWIGRNWLNRASLPTVEIGHRVAA